MLVYYRTYTSLKTLAKLHIGKNFTFSKLNAIFSINNLWRKKTNLSYIPSIIGRISESPGDYLKCALIVLMLKEIRKSSQCCPWYETSLAFLHLSQILFHSVFYF